MTGKSMRLKRLGREGLYLVLPLDHGASMGPLPGLENVSSVVQESAAGGATGVVVHKGLVRNVARAHTAIGTLLHVSASTDRSPDPEDKRIVAEAEDALRLGCDGLSTHTNVGSRTEGRQLEELGRLTSAAGGWGLPVLAMMYPRGPSIKDPYGAGVVAHAARLAEELGADLVKTLYTGSAKTFRDVTASVSVPVLVAGGPRSGTDRELLELVHGAMRGGAAGVSIGRNIFQHRSPRAITAAIARVVFEGATPVQALAALKEVKA